MMRDLPVGVSALHFALDHPARVEAVAQRQLAPSLARQLLQREGAHGVTSPVRYFCAASAGSLPVATLAAVFSTVSTKVA